jgi:hypothetical protein
VVRFVVLEPLDQNDFSAGERVERVKRLSRGSHENFKPADCGLSVTSEHLNVITGNTGRSIAKPDYLDPSWRSYLHPSVSADRHSAPVTGTEQP